jgi:hypothetical protein
VAGDQSRERRGDKVGQMRKDSFHLVLENAELGRTRARAGPLSLWNLSTLELKSLPERSKDPSGACCLARAREQGWTRGL